jgi:HK97 gp10 family phage protein
MATGVSFKISGDKELQRALNALPGKVQKKIMRGALREAAKVVAAEARARVPVETGTLRDSIKVRALKGKRGSVGASVESGEGQFKDESFYGAFIEFGTRNAPAKPFLRPAAKSKQPACVAVVAEAIRTRIDAEAKKA